MDDESKPLDESRAITIVIPMVVILKSDYGSDRRKQYFVLGCERGGVYKLNNKKLKFEDTRMRKCGCPFRLHGYFHASEE
jgi:hypothetical protein